MVSERRCLLVRTSLQFADRPRGVNADAAASRVRVQRAGCEMPCPKRGGDKEGGGSGWPMMVDTAVQWCR